MTRLGKSSRHRVEPISTQSMLDLKLVTLNGSSTLDGYEKSHIESIMLRLNPHTAVLLNSLY
jgi:hypothetical protein